MSTNIIKSNTIVLRKNIYQESSLIVYTLTPEYGRIDFLIRGALKVSNKQSPIIDIFREVEISFNEKNSGLYTPRSIDLVAEHDTIALHPPEYKNACNIAAFLLKNSYANINCRFVYSALKKFLHNAAKGIKYPYPETIIKLVYLYENGLLPDDLLNEDTPKAQHKLLKILLNYAVTSKIKSLPDISTEYWEKFSAWINAMCNYHSLQ